MIEHETSALLDWAVAARPLAGHACSGDVAVVEAFEGGMLVAVIDGLGHGDAAAAVARIAEAALRQDAGPSIANCLRTCHAALRGTRGAVAGVVSLSAVDRVLRWGGVGDVQGLLVRARPGTRHTMPMTGGVLGDRLPRLRTGESPILPGDTLVLVSDGIGSGFAVDVFVAAPVRSIAVRLLERHGRVDDDAIALVARWRGGNA